MRRIWILGQVLTAWEAVKRVLIRRESIRLQACKGLDCVFPRHDLGCGLNDAGRATPGCRHHGASRALPLLSLKQGRECKKRTKNWYCSNRNYPEDAGIPIVGQGLIAVPRPRLYRFFICVVWGIKNDRVIPRNGKALKAFPAVARLPRAPTPRWRRAAPRRRSGPRPAPD